MNTAKLNEEIISIILLIAAMFAARPFLNWLLLKLYNLFIGRDHI